MERTFAAWRLDLPHHRFALVLPSRGDDDLGTFASELESRGRSDARAAARHDRHSAIKVLEPLFSPSSNWKT
jgi:hypothetical protein